MRRQSLALALAFGIGAGCFPDPPARDSATSTDVETSVPGDTHSDDGDLAVQESDGVEVAPDAVGAETDSSGSDVADADTARDDWDVETPDGEVLPPACDGDEDCTQLADDCMKGTCDNGRCIASPLTATSCDDGQRCTEDDTCDNGTCAGNAKVCAALDQCHDIGVCDAATGVCSNPTKPPATDCDDSLACTTDDTCLAGACVGNAVICAPLDQCHDAGMCDTATGNCSNPARAADAECDDGLACTVADTCGTGTCAGTEVVCLPLDQCHDAGECDALTGTCSNPSKSNAWTCDDGDKCTENDACNVGVCGGTAVVCTPTDECHDAGVCSTLTGLCSDPARGNGVPCNDNDRCTLGDACSSGFCVGPDSPQRSDFNLGIILADGKGGLTAFGATTNGGAKFAVNVRGTEVHAAGSSQELLDQDTNGLCAVYFGEARPSGSIARFDKWTQGTTCSYSVRISLWQLHPLGDKTTLALGIFAEPFTTTLGARAVGVSPTGLLLNQGKFAARLAEDGRPVWIVGFLGFDDSLDGYDPPSMAVGPSSEMFAAINFGDDANFREIVPDSGPSVVIEDVADGDMAAVYRISATGSVSEFVRFTGEPAQLAIRDIYVAPDGTLVVLGLSTAGGTSFATATASGTIATGIAGQWEGWVVAIAPSGAIKWSRHFFVAPGGGVDERQLYLIPQQIVASNSDVWVALFAERFVRTRNDVTTGTLLGSSVEGPNPGNSTIVHLAMGTGAVLDAQVVGSASTYIGALAIDDRGPAVVGRSLAVTIDGVVIGNGVDQRPFVNRLGSWAVQFASRSPDTGTFLSGAVNGFFEPIATSDRTGGFFVGGVLLGSATMGSGNTAEIQFPASGTASYLLRIGSNGWRDCD